MEGNNSKGRLFLVQAIIGWLFFFILGAGGAFLILNAKLPSKQEQAPRPLPEKLSGESIVITPQQDATSEDSYKWQKPSSTKKGFPIVDSQTNALAVFLLDAKQLKDTGKKSVEYGSGWLGHGRSDPLPSPDLLYTAFIENGTRQLKLLSNETFEEAPILPGEKVDYIFGWSPDSKKIIYYISPDTLAIRRQGPHQSWEGKEQFDPKRESGFSLFNIDTGEAKKLYPIEEMVAFIDNSRILARAGKDEYMNKRLVVFNVVTFEADYGLVKDEFGFGASNFSFSHDGSKWTYTLSRNPTEDANIIYADFPNKEGIEVDKGSWAEVQHSFISPLATRIAYWKKEGDIEQGVPRTRTVQGVPKFAVWVYNTQDNAKEKYAEGMVVGWVDENRLIYRVQKDSASDNTFYLLDLTTKESTQMN